MTGCAARRQACALPPNSVKWPGSPGLFFPAVPGETGLMSNEPLKTGRGIVIPPEELDEQFIRAAGPGGQNVNKVSTAVQLRFDAARSRALPDDVRRRLIALAGRRATKEGVIVIEAGRFRTQERNRADAQSRLASLIDLAAEPPPPPRRKTRPSRGAIEERLKEKTGRGAVKRLRGKVRLDD